MSTKHEQIVEYIETLPIGARISVRSIAKAMTVSEGTAYRAIKDAEAQGLVSSMDRVGTIRIERKEKKHIERLTYAEVVNIVDGTVLGGRAGLHKTLQKFVIGAMQMEAAVRYIEPDSLMIVGNRQQIQRIALQHGAAVLITGGFTVADDVQELADRLELPIISCSYDTFTTAALINRAIYDRLIKKDILLVEDILPQDELATMKKGSTVSAYRLIVEQTGHGKFPVVDEEGRLVGIVTAKDVTDADDDDLIDLHMTRQPFAVTLKTPIASAAHQMVWEGVEMMPVVQGKKLVGAISRQDVIKALQLMGRQPQMGETLEGSVLRGFDEIHNEDKSVTLQGVVTAQMIGPTGTLAMGALTTLIENCAVLSVHRQRKADVVVENITLYFLKPVSVDAEIELRGRVMDLGRRFAKVDIEVFAGDTRVAKALLTTQTLER
ncbi:DRTGG domain-containing protein [Alicyclobacillus mengziensis]|uniref:CBS domain-containing protein n=1 Tax=Alicyclobacillus mengziensis TaxID=2931921 RepID=A0A9X7VZW4_9BACL|nr:DRTGG domain-containing protein [Alicyclobacillus mengziensis]QSO46778.1 CBS domain-containing protein [Alicyclobacillus mengziensis]